MEKKIGHYSFIGGVAIAAISGIFFSGNAAAGSPQAMVGSLLVILGLIAGFLNVTGKETKEQLMVAAVLVIAAYAGGATDILSSVEYVGKFLTGIFNNMLAFVVPATIVVALKDIWALGQNN